MKKSLLINTGDYGINVQTALSNSYNMVAQPRLKLDWNLNRYSTPVATNTPDEDDEGFDIETYPIESIVEPLRPTKGVSKARVNQGTVAPGYIKSHSPRFYVSNEDDVYKYWTSPYSTGPSGNFPLHTDGLTTARPRVTYDRVLACNKIVIKLENTWASPKVHAIYISNNTTISGSAIATNPVISNDGTITLWYDGAAWVSTRPTNPVTTDVQTIEYRVDSMKGGVLRDGRPMAYRKRAGTAGGGYDTWYPTDGASSALNVIAIEAHFERYLTNRLISVEDTFDMSESSQLYPIGTITTNTATVTFSNEDGVFNPENQTSPYYKLIEPNVEFTLDWIYTISGIEYSVKEFVMYATAWSNSDGTTTVELEDYSKYLKEIKPRPFMVEGKTDIEIIWRVLDSVGFVDYDITSEDLAENALTIPVFWTTGEETVWEVLDELARATQTAIYIDAFGHVQVRSRKAAFKDDAPINWTLRGEKIYDFLPDIINWNPGYEYEANKIDVTYKTTKWKTDRTGKPAMSKVWEPPGETMTVRSSQLFKDITTDSNHIFLDQKEAKIWPYKSKVQIDGEIIQYEGKQYKYFTYSILTDDGGVETYSNETAHMFNVTSNEDLIRINRKTPKTKRHKNYFTGGLKITERAVWNTEKRNHKIDTDGWVTKAVLKGKTDQTVLPDAKGFHQNRKKSTVTINTPPKMNDANDTFFAVRGSADSTSYKSYGTKFQFENDKASPTQIAGFAYQLSGAVENGYFVEVRTSGSLSASERAASNEITVYSKVGGKQILVAKGAPIAIAEKIWYELDIYHSGTGNNQQITVFLNGQLAAQGTTNAQSVQDESGRFGFFARGKTKVNFEYAYAVARNVNEPADDYGFYDLKYGGVRGGQWEREYVWDMRTRRRRIKKKKWKKETYRHNEYFFDEFGPYVHEVREMDVKFDPSPVRYSYLFNTNEWYSAVPEYVSDPFGARFIIANVARFHAILNGEDNLIYAGASSGVNQVCVVLGQNLEIAEDETVTRRNEPSIRKRGLIESELSSDWIQTKSMATYLADWMSNHWSDSVDQAEVEIFGNPLIEIGDKVSIHYPRENMAVDSHVYFVVGTKNSFEYGITTTLTLRRQRPADIS